MRHDLDTTILICLILIGCSYNSSTTTEHPDGRVESQAVGAQVATGHATSASSGESQTGDTGSTETGARSTTKPTPKTTEEIRAEAQAELNRTLFWTGLALLAVFAIGWGAKTASAAAFGSNMLLNAIASMPTWLLNLAGVGGASCFAWSMLGRKLQMGIAAATIVGLVLTGYASWKSSHKGHVARRRVKLDSK